MTRSNQNVRSSKPEVFGMSRHNSNKTRLVTNLSTFTILALAIALPCVALSQIRLLPAPREAHFAGEITISRTLIVEVPGHDPEDDFAARDLQEVA
jgi:hypothetical protein